MQFPVEDSTVVWDHGSLSGKLTINGDSGYDSLTNMTDFWKEQMSITVAPRTVDCHYKGVDFKTEIKESHQHCFSHISGRIIQEEVEFFKVVYPEDFEVFLKDWKDAYLLKQAERAFYS